MPVGLILVAVVVGGSIEQHPHPETAVETLHHEHEVVLVLLELRLGELEPARVAAPARPEVHPRPLVEAQVVEVHRLDARVEPRRHGVLLLRRGRERRGECGRRRRRRRRQEELAVVLPALPRVRQHAVRMLDLVHGVSELGPGDRGGGSS